MNYQVINDEAKVKEFIDWLPDCEEHEQFYCCLFMRKKYLAEEEKLLMPWIKSDKGQLKRFTSTKERLFEKISQLECSFGAFKFRDNPVPQQSLALYISTNPRNLWLATIRSISALAKVIECQGKNSNPHQEVMSEIQRTPSKRKYVIFDIDEKNPDTLKFVIDKVDGFCDVIETRGGYHVFVEKEKVSQISDKTWYKQIVQLHSVDQAGDLMSPVPGTFQGGWTPTFIRKRNHEESN